jgi:hypothetical protein
MSDLFTPARRQAPGIDPRVHLCAREGCGKPGATCGMGAQWFCWRTCTPADWPGQIPRAAEMDAGSARISA